MLLCLIWLSLRRGWYVSLLLSFPPFPRTDCGFSPTPHSTLRREGGRKYTLQHRTTVLITGGPHSRHVDTCVQVCACARSILAILLLCLPYCVWPLPLFIQAAVIDRGCVAPLFPPLPITVWRYVGYVDRRHLLGFCRGRRSAFVLRNSDRQRISRVHFILYLYYVIRSSGSLPLFIRSKKVGGSRRPFFFPSRVTPISDPLPSFLPPR